MVATSALAQPQPPRGPMDARPRGGGGMMRSAKMRLPRLVEGATRLSGANALSKTQVRRLVSLVSPWRSRLQMSESQAQTLLTGVSGVLTSAQKTAMQADRPRFGGARNGQGGPRSGAGDGRGGAPRGGRDSSGPREGFGGGPMQGQRPSGAGRDAMRAMMASFNPLYSGASRQMSGLPERAQQRVGRERDQLNAALSQLQQKAR